MRNLFGRAVVLVAVVMTASGLVLVDAGAQKMTAEDVIAKHLDAIGTADDRAKMKNITAVGEVAFGRSASSANSAPLYGKVVFASENEKSLLAMNFPSPAYQGEKFVWDGKTLFVDFSTPGSRSILGNYLYQFDRIIKDGLLAGSMGKGWSMLDVGSHNVKLSLDGTKTINDRETYVVKYEPKKGSDVKIKLYFDKETFRHVRTEVQRLNSAGMGNNMNAASRVIETHENLTADYSDFKTEFGVTLPHTWKITLYVERPQQTFESTYTMTFSDFYYNSALDPATFATR